MAYVLRDKDLGMECEFEAHGETPQDVKQNMFEHAKEAHADMFVTFSPKQQEEMSKKMDELIKEE